MVMPLINKLYFLYQLLLNYTQKIDLKCYPLTYLENISLKIPFASYKKAKIIIIHDIDNLGWETELKKMIEIEKEYGVTSILMLMPFNTLCYSEKFNNPIGLHETFPFRFKKGVQAFEKYDLKPCCFSQHVSIKATNFYPTTLNCLNDLVEYAFIDPTCFGFNPAFPISLKPIKYRNLTLIFTSQEPSKEDLEKILESCSKQNGIVAFNFHPDYFFRNSKVLLHLVKKTTIN